MNAYEILCEDKVAAVVRAPSVADPAGLADALAGSGVRLVEFTFTIPGAVNVIRAASDSNSATVGAGTVMTADQARAALDAGARFLVSPALRPEIAEVGAAARVPVFLGAFTPTEIADAVDIGAAAVKLFPARVGGPDYLRDLRGPFPDVALLPSGGVGEDNVGEWLEAGAPAVFAGSSMVPSEAVARGDHDEIVRRAKSFVARVGRS